MKTKIFSSRESFRALYCLIVRNTSKRQTKDFDAYEETDKPLLDIEAVYYDGLTLAFVAAPTKEAQKYVNFESFGTRINGEAGVAGLMYAEGKFNLEEENADKDTAVSGYYFSGATCDLNLESPFTVTVPLRVYGENGRCENQDLTFTVNLPSQAESFPDQDFTQDDFTVTLTAQKKTPVSLYGIITVKMTETKYAAWQQSHNTENTSAVILPLFTDPEGNTCTLRSLKESKEIAETSKTSKTKEITKTKEIIESKAITETQEIEGAPGSQSSP